MYRPPSSTEIRRLGAPTAVVAPPEPDPPPANRREFFRFKPRPEVGWACRCVPSRGQANLLVCLVDVGAGGVRLVLRGRLEEGAYLELRFDSPSLRGPKHLLASVVWTSSTVLGQTELGTQFVRPLSPAELRLLAQD